MSRIPIAAEDVSYSSMTKVGKIEVRPQENGQLAILIEGFEFDDLPTCRMSAVRSMAWLRDVLDGQIKLQTLINRDVYSAMG